MDNQKPYAYVPAFLPLFSTYMHPEDERANILMQNIARCFFLHTESHDRELIKNISSDLSTMFGEQDTEGESYDVLAQSIVETIYLPLYQKEVLPACKYDASFDRRDHQLSIYLPQKEAYDCAIFMSSVDNTMLVKKAFAAELTRAAIYREVYDAVGYVRNIIDCNGLVFRPLLKTIDISFDNPCREEKKQLKVAEIELKSLLRYGEYMRIPHHFQAGLISNFRDF